MRRLHFPFLQRCPVAVCVATAFALAACGGGGSGDSNDTPPVDFDSISINPTTSCDLDGIGAATLVADAPVTVLEVSGGSTGDGDRDREYCLVKVRVEPAVNIWVSLPASDWNGRFRAEGNGVYGGSAQLAVTVDSIRQGFVGVKTDTGHVGTSALDGSFGMAAPGVPDLQAQEDFAHRSMHLMAVVGKQLTEAFYGESPVRSYWYGCSTGGRQGLMMAQRYPEDFDAILAGAPAIHWDRFQAYQIWPQVVMRHHAGGPVSVAKQVLATNRAIEMCDGQDGVIDGVLEDPRACNYDPTLDSFLTRADCEASDDSCLSQGEASAILKIWEGAQNIGGQLLWPGLDRGTSLAALAGATPFPIPIEQARYWTYLDPAWEWTTLTLQNYEAFFQDNARVVGPVMATDQADLSAFKARGGKLILYHGWSDPLIMAQGTVKYYERVQQAMGEVDDFARLYMVPGMGHCGGGTGVTEFGQQSSGAVPMNPDTDVFRALMAWSEQGAAPQEIIGSRLSDEGAVVRTRPLCPYPQVASYLGVGSTDVAENFACVHP